MPRPAAILLILVFSCVSTSLVRSQVPAAQYPSATNPTFPTRDEEENARLPNGKLKSEEILKEEHGKSLEDASRLVALSQELQHDLEKSGANILSIGDIHKTEEIEKLAKRIRSRIRRS